MSHLQNKNYICKNCNYLTCNKKDFNKHINTKKHKINTNQHLGDFFEKSPNSFEKSPNQNSIENFQIGQKTHYHKNIVDNEHSIQNEKNIKEYICLCGKKYKERTGFWKHKKKCPIQNKELLFFSDKSSTTENIIKVLQQNTTLITQNQEFKDLLIEQNKIIMEISKNAGNNNNVINSNNNNKTFNLQVFLNEKCKDALNITDFVNSLKLTLEDLENVGDKGFVNGITRIFVNGLKQLDIYKRPIHCSDLKRETMYLKNENVWEKDNDNKEQMKKVIKQIANKNINKIYEWKDKYPDCKYSDSKKNDQYSRIIIESMGAKTVEEDQLLYEKIIKNIAKETIINKK